MQVDTGSLCPFCKSAVVAEVDSVPTESPSLIPVGPCSKGYYRKIITSFHCNNPNCYISFYRPPRELINSVSRILERIQTEEDVENAPPQPKFSDEEIREWARKAGLDPDNPPKPPE